MLAGAVMETNMLCKYEAMQVAIDGCANRGVALEYEGADPGDL